MQTRTKPAVERVFDRPRHPGRRTLVPSGRRPAGRPDPRARPKPLAPWDAGPSFVEEVDDHDLASAANDAALLDPDFDEIDDPGTLVSRGRDPFGDDDDWFAGRP